MLLHARGQVLARREQRAGDDAVREHAAALLATSAEILHVPAPNLPVFCVTVQGTGPWSYACPLWLGKSAFCNFGPPSAFMERKGFLFNIFVVFCFTSSKQPFIYLGCMPDPNGLSPFLSPSLPCAGTRRAPAISYKVQLVLLETMRLKARRLFSSAAL